MVSANVTIWIVIVEGLILLLMFFLARYKLQKIYNESLAVKENSIKYWRAQAEEARKSHPKPKHTMVVYVYDDEERRLLCGIIATNGYKVWTGDTVVDQTTVYVEELGEEQS